MTYEELLKFRESIYELVDRYHVQNPRLFGSVAMGSQHSDIDLLVDATLKTTLFDIGGLSEELSQLLKTPVNVVTPEDLSASFRQEVVANAKPI